MRIPSSLGPALATASGLVCLLALAIAPAPAAACGGCFGPQGQATEVTAHRMAVMFSADETTLWDQFEYTGEPEDFVWVLPVAGTDDVQIDLASNDFFLALSQTTQVQLSGPFRSTGRGGGGGFGCGASAPSDASESGPQSNVTVFGQEVVGPYETVTIGAEDPDALVTWLSDNGYGVPANMEPAIAHYVDLGMNFVALRLAPGEGVARMQPVRITTPGMNTSFPLRMVGAGVTSSVALELFVLAEGRYEAANFDNLEVDRDAIHYDWATQAYNYDALAAGELERSAGGGWLTEAAIEVYLSSLQNVYVQDDEGVGRRAEADDDFAHVDDAFGDSSSAGGGTVFVSRMRADLPFDALRVDLNLQASLEPSLHNQISVQREVNVDRDPARASSGLTEATFPVWAVVLGGAFLAFAGSRRRWR